jgi:ribose/xylose/arabinose/galactoside ABC-type transport system permease subunit
MTGDIDVPASPLVAAAPPAERPPEEQAARIIITSIAVSVPIVIALFVGLVALAVHNQQPDWNAWLSMSAGIGLLAGVFTGLLAGFVRSSHLFDD